MLLYRTDITSWHCALVCEFWHSLSGSNLEHTTPHRVLDSWDCNQVKMDDVCSYIRTISQEGRLQIALGRTKDCGLFETLHNALFEIVCSGDGYQLWPGRKARSLSFDYSFGVKDVRHRRVSRNSISQCDTIQCTLWILASTQCAFCQCVINHLFHTSNCHVKVI